MRVHEPNGLEPIPGETRLALLVTVVMLAVSVLGLVAALVAGIFADGLGATVAVCAVLAAVSLGGVVVTGLQRRRDLRARMFGEPQVRERWTGPGPTHTW